MSKGSAIIAILIAFVGGIAIGNLTSSGGEGGDVSPVRIGAAAGGEAEAAPAEVAGEEIVRFRVPVTDAQPSKGPDDALVTIVEFSEFQCPFCSRVLPTMNQIREEYGDRVRIVWRNNPLAFHPNAGPAAQVAMEAFEQGGDQKFWQLHDVLFENQRSLERPNLERFAQQAGLNMDQVRAALDNNEHNAAIQGDQRLAGQIGARGTPNFFINGRQVTGAQPFDAFKTIIDDELRRAQQLVQSGTPANQVYAALTREGRTSPAAAPAAADAPARPARPQPDPNAVYKLELNDGPYPQEGPNDALVTIVEFSDFECPFCSRVNPTIDQIREEYGNDVRVVWMNNPLPFHQHATPAANFALEAFEQGGNEKFWAAHELLFENQRALTTENFTTWAGQLGLNVGQVNAAIENNEHNATITAQQAIARRLGASGTPSFFINGRNLRGAQPFDAFKRVIDEELAKARELVSNGTPRAGVYAATVRDGATEQVLLPAAPGAAAAPQRPAAPDPDQRYEIRPGQNSPSHGASNPRVTIYEFSDFQCPFCSRVNPTIAQILETYGDRVQIVWRDFPLPFHNNAHLAAQAAREVHRQGGNEKFWAYHDLLFANQRALERPTLERLAGELGGINMTEFRAALDSERHKAAVDADMAAARASGARIGTPSFFINGRLVSGAQPFPAFQAAIDRALEEAN